MTTSKRTFPLLAMVLIAMVIAVGPAFAKRDSANTIPEWITVSALTVKVDTAETEITVKGDFPPNYLTYRPTTDRLILEMRDCDVSQLDIPSLAKSPHVLEMTMESETDGEGASLARFLFTLASGVKHAVRQVGNDLVVTFTSDASQAPTPDPVTTVTEPVAGSTAAAPAVSAVSRVPDSRGFIAYREFDAATFAAQAGMSGQARGRALTGVDTSDGERNHVLLLTDGPASFSTFELADPPRLVVDFQGLTNEVLASRIPMDSSFVKQVRVSQFRTEPNPVVRAVFDLNKSASYDLKPSVAGLNITFRRPDLAGAMDAEMVAVPAMEPVTMASLAAESDTLEPSDYAFFSEADTDDPGDRSGVKLGAGLTFESKIISDKRAVYTGRRISLELVDADLKQVFRLFHEISGLNFILDPSVGGKVTVVLDNVPWDQCLDIILRNSGLAQTFENNVVRISTTTQLAKEAQQRRALKEAQLLDEEPVTITRKLSYAKAQEVDRIIKRMLTGGATGGSSRFQSQYDERTNIIIFTTIPGRAEAISKLLDELDQQSPQVMIEARIVETSREFTRDLGIDWGFLANDQRGAGNSFSVDYDLNLPRVADANRLGLFFGDLGPNGFAIDIALDALETEGRGRVLSAPKIMAQNNTTAIIEQGTQIPVVNTTATEINVEFISASLKLEVTPQITAEGTIIMDIKVENNSPDFNNRVGTTPAINTQRASTRVLVEDGGTAVIGGVFFLNEGESEVGVPGLRKIPGLGWLFRNRNITKQNKELLIFITPKIVN